MPRTLKLLSYPLALCTFALPACKFVPYEEPDMLSETGEDGVSGDGPQDAGDDGGSADAGDSGGDDGPIPDEPTNHKLDILLVVDNSGSMGEEQSKLAEGLGDLFAVLEAPENDIEWRLGVTTTDNGNPWCGTTSPEAGSLVYSSCLNRVGSFTNQQGDTDVSEVACLNHCLAGDIQLSTNGGKPWLEAGSVPQGLTATETAACIVPQGIDGCGFESQLESLARTLQRSTNDAAPEFGFIRDDANLLIVVLTDEADCSYQESWKSIFETTGNKVFWHPDSPTSPTSALCWNAGTNCTPTGEGTYDCMAQDYDVDGNAISPDDPLVLEQAVLHPLARYRADLEELRLAKQAHNPGARVALNLIAGFGPDQELLYADPDESLGGFDASFGIGPGCTSTAHGSIACVVDADCDWTELASCGPQGYCLETQTAIPPVRQFEISDIFRPGMNASICEDGYGQKLAAMALDAVGL